MFRDEEIHFAIDRFEKVDWLGDDFTIDRAACEEVVKRLYERQIIDEEFADNLLFALSCSPHNDSRRFAYWLGANVLIWLVAFSSIHGADNPQFGDLDTHLADWTPADFYGKTLAKRGKASKESGASSDQAKDSIE